MQTKSGAAKKWGNYAPKESSRPPACTEVSCSPATSEAWRGAARLLIRRTTLVIIPTNNMATEVFLIPRADFMNERASGRNFNGDWEFAPMLGTPYGMKRRTLRTPMGSFCNPPPWGMLNAVIPILPKSNGPFRSANSLRSAARPADRPNTDPSRSVDPLSPRAD